MNNLENNSLIKVNERSIFYRIKNFFRNLFGKNKVNECNNSIISPNVENLKQNQKTKSEFMDSIKNTENEETKLLKLQKRYEESLIKEEDIPYYQIEKLEALYNKQNRELEKSNVNRIKKIKDNPDSSKFIEEIKSIENKKETKLHKLQQRYENNELSESDLTDEQVDNLLDLYQDQINGLEKANLFRKQKLLLYRKNMQSA